MTTAIFGAIGFIIGIINYGSKGAETKSLYIPIMCACIGIVIGGVIDVLVNAVKGKRGTKWVLATFFIVTSVCLGLTFYAFLTNWAYIYSKGLNEVLEGNILYGLINMILFPIVMCIQFFATDGGCEVSLIIGYAFSLVYAIILSFLFGYSDVASSASDHQGKYKVTVDAKTGVEVGERVPLDAYTEAFKENALIVLFIILGTLLCPFLAYGIGYFICFRKLLEKLPPWVSIIAVIAFTVLCYVLLGKFGI
ncbi:MAG: hypothetical protein IKV61_03295 [Clostridia bacterium]|nr:hypothetical protein [Clostridia bacterium]